MATFEEILERDGRLVYKTRGTSMQPLLKQNRDLVLIEPAKGRLKPYDAALYVRGEQYVLHRVIKLAPEYYVIRGDNTFSLETVPFDAVKGVLTGFVRKGKQHSVNETAYRIYARVWTAIYPLRALKRRLRVLTVWALKKTGLYGPLKRIVRRGKE